MSYLDREGKEIILIGDTNCDVSQLALDQPTDNAVQHMPNIYELLSFSQLIKELTQATLNTSTIIDHVATTASRSMLKSSVYKVSMSDHFMVYCIKKLSGAVTIGHKTIKTQNEEL